MNETEDNHTHTGLVLCQFVLHLFPLTSLTNLHHSLIYSLSISVLTQFWHAAFYHANPSFLMAVSLLIYAYPFQEHN